MKLDIYDIDVVSAIRPLEAAAYLRTSGWTQQAVQPGKASIWVRQSEGAEHEALLPLSQDFRDYNLRMGDLLQVLSTVEKRSQALVLEDLLATTSDVVRIRIDDPELAEGTLPLISHTQIAQKTRDVILAAACSAITPRAVWHTRKPLQAMEFLQHTRVGQTKRGSYTFTVLSRVPPMLHAAEDDSLPPYERQVTAMLARALIALNGAAEEATLTSEFRAFETGVAEGISANLCDAVAGFWGDGDIRRRLEFTFTWSAARPAYAGAPAEVAFDAGDAPVIREAGRMLRERSPIVDFELEGAVVKLERSEGEVTGRATVMGIIDDQPRRVVVELTDTDYHYAVEAHDQQRPMRCVGTLVREGKLFRLHGARDISLQKG